MKKIAIYSESQNGIIDDTAYELVSKTRELCNTAKNNYNIDIEITTILISNEVSQESVKKVFLAGSHNFVLIKNDNFVKFPTYSC